MIILKKNNIATLKDVATASGVSSTAASLVLNNRPNNISEKTKEKILKVAKELDYHPNYTARSLATKKTKTIGVIIPDISNAFFAEAVRTIQVELSKNGYDMFLCNSEEKFENDIKYIKLFANRNVDGLILTMSAESMIADNQKTIAKLLKTYQIPYVLFDRYYPNSKYKVFVDNFSSGYEVAKLLLNLGHTNIGVITGPLNLNSAQDRLLGLKKACEEHNVILEDSKIVQGKYDMDSGREGAKKLLGNVTAIFAFNDLQAFGVIETAKSMGLKIPEDFSLVGFDDIFYSTILDTRLTTVRQPIFEMSKIICESLITLMNDSNKEVNVAMKAELIVRDSVRMVTK